MSDPLAWWLRHLPGSPGTPPVREPQSWEIAQLHREMEIAVGGEERYCRCRFPFVVLPNSIKKFCCETCRGGWAAYDRANRISDALETVLAEGHALSPEAYKAMNNLRLWLVRRPKEPAYCQRCLRERQRESARHG